MTDRGRTLMRIYNEMDLLTAESLRAGLWDGLDPSELAAVLSTLVYEARAARRREPRRGCPGGPVKRGPRRDGLDLGGPRRPRARPPPRPAPRARPRLRVGRLPLGRGRRARRRPRRHRPRRRRLRALGQAAARPRRPGRRRCRLRRRCGTPHGRPSPRLRRGVVAYSSVSE